MKLYFILVITIVLTFNIVYANYPGAGIANNLPGVWTPNSGRGNSYQDRYSGRRRNRNRPGADPCCLRNMYCSSTCGH